MTMPGRVLLDAGLFSLVPETEACAGWGLQRMQKLMGEVENERAKYGNPSSFLLPELRRRHRELGEDG